MAGRNFTFLELHVHDTAGVTRARSQRATGDDADGTDRDDRDQTGGSRMGKGTLIGAALLLVLVGVVAKRRMGDSGDEGDEFETFEEADEFDTFEETTPE